MLEKKPSSAAPDGFPPLFVSAISLILLIAAVVLATALFSYDPTDPAWRHNGEGVTHNRLGVIGAWYSDLSFSLIGKLSYLLPLALLAFCVNAWLEKRFDKELLSWRLLMLFAAILSGCVLWAKHDPVAINTVAQTGGGALGAWLTIGLEKSINSIPVVMAFSAIIFIISISLLLNIPWLKFADWTGKTLVDLCTNLFARGNKKAAPAAFVQAPDDSAENSALQDKIKNLNKIAEQRQYEKMQDDASDEMPPRPHFTIDRYDPEQDVNIDELAPRFIHETAPAEQPAVAKPKPQPAPQPAMTTRQPLNETRLQAAPAEKDTPPPRQTATKSGKAEPSFFDFSSIKPATPPLASESSSAAGMAAARRAFADEDLTAQDWAPQTSAPPVARRQTPAIPAAKPQPIAEAVTQPQALKQSLGDTFAEGGVQALTPEKPAAPAEPVPAIEPSESLKRALSDAQPAIPMPQPTSEPEPVAVTTVIPEAKPRPLDMGSLHTTAIADEFAGQASDLTAAEPVTASATPKAAAQPQVAEIEATMSVASAATAAPKISPTAKPATQATISQAYANNEQESVQRIDANRPYELPSVQLLDNPPPQENAYTEDVLADMAGVLESTLNQFNIKAIVMHVSPGPVITRFELELAPGIQAKKITNLSQDLARALAVSRVRVEEVIPGSSYVGLEVPNKQRQIVYFKDVVRAKVFQQSRSPLTISLGSDTSGKPVVADLMKMPHALVAGTTGSGKSVCINVMLLSMLYKASPKDLRLILVDPKMLEMSMYEDIPHLLTPVITDMNEAENALTWAVGEMERRYQLMAALKVRKIDAFNQQVDEANARGEPIKDPLWQPDESVGYTHHPNLERLPFIVIVIDELADMMMVVGKQVEQLIARLTQKARAAGIHVVLATQRPSTDVLTGLIKANVPTRIAFQVSSGTDSRVIIDSVGAEKLLGHGDMLYVPPGVSHPQRLHGAFVGDAETDRITNYLRSIGEPNYIDGITGKQDPETLGAFGAAEAAEATENADPLYEEAVQIVLQTGKASISSVQRQLRIGYNRAARMIEDMQAQGIVSEPVNGIRKVLGAPKPKTDV